MRWKLIFVLCLVALSFLIFYKITGDATYSRQIINVTRVIDGDTVVLENNVHVRLLGMNTPEKNQPFHDEAMNRLKGLVEGKKVEFESHGLDKYKRTLGYLYLNGELINKKQLDAGFANLYYYGTDSNYNEMKKAEEAARNNEIGIWKKSKSFGCLKLIDLKYLDGGNCKNQEQLVIENDCSSMNVIIKDDANHIYDEKINSGIYTQNFSCIWNDNGDTLYIRDNSGLLLFYRYA